jgi:hypothetical protein
MGINDWTVEPDASRTLTATPPFRVIAGRGIVDAHGRHVLTCNARRMVDDDGRVRDGHEWGESNVLTPTQANANVHAIAAMLNAHAALRAERDTLRRALANVMPYALSRVEDMHACGAPDVCVNTAHAVRCYAEASRVLGVRDGETLSDDLPDYCAHCEGGE